MGRPGVMFYFSTRPCLKRLSLEEKGALFEAILDYGEFGTFPDFDNSPGLAVAWDFTQQLIDQDGERYGAKILQRRYATYCREMKKADQPTVSFDEWVQSSGNGNDQPTSTDNGRYPITNTIPITVTDSITNTKTIDIKADKPPAPARKKFVPPTIEQVRDYCKERENSVDPERFVGYYTANGWIQGGGKPIKDWRACVRTWERNGKEGNANVHNAAGDKGKTWNLPGVKPL